MSWSAVGFRIRMGRALWISRRDFSAPFAWRGKVAAALQSSDTTVRDLQRARRHVYLWCQLEPRVRARVVQEHALRESVMILAGEPFYVDQGGGNQLRLCYRSQPTSRAIHVVKTLARSLAAIAGEGRDPPSPVRMGLTERDHEARARVGSACLRALQSRLSVSRCFGGDDPSVSPLDLRGEALHAAIESPDGAS